MGSSPAGKYKLVTDESKPVVPMFPGQGVQGDGELHEGPERRDILREWKLSPGWIGSLNPGFRVED